MYLLSRRGERPTQIKYVVDGRPNDRGLKGIICIHSVE